MSDRHKLLQFLRWAGSSSYTIFALQDHRLATDPFVGDRDGERSRLFWDGSYFFTPGSQQDQGVLLLFKHSPLLTDIALFQPASPSPPQLQGRHLRVDFSFGPHLLSLHTVYAPAQAAARGEFFRALSSSAFAASPGRCHVLCGDFNTTLGPLDRTRRASSSIPGAVQLGELVALHQLVDVWREEHPGDCDLTFFSSGQGGGTGTGVRLDRFYVGSQLAGLPGVSSDILPTTPIVTDHLPVVLFIPGPAVPDPFAKSRWHLPLFVLSVPDLCDRLRSWLLSSLSSAPPSINRWLVIKAQLRTFVVKLASEYRARLQREIVTVDRAAAAARRDMVRCAASGDEALLLLYRTAWHAHRRAAEDLEQQRSMTREAVEEVRQQLFGSQGINIFRGEARSPTRIPYLHDLDAPLDAPASAAADLSTSSGMGRAYVTLQGHFSRLFHDRPSDPAATATLLAALPRSLPPPPPSSFPPGQGLLSLSELDAALKRAANGKSPGLDGIPFEFYKVFWGEVGPFLRDVLNSTFSDSSSDSPLAPLLEGLLCLIPKKGKPRNRITSYRALTLLGADVKLAALAIADRMQLPLDSLIDDMQGAFIRGRDISDNILFRLSFLEYLRDTGHPAWLILTDLANAYDSVRRAYLYSCLETMGFGRFCNLEILRWVRILLGGTSASVLVNGRVLPRFSILEGLPQGSPLSPLLFIVVINPLHEWLNTHAANGRPLLPDGSPSPVANLFADDIGHIESAEHLSVNGRIIAQGYQYLEDGAGVALGIPKCGAIPPPNLPQPPPSTLSLGPLDIPVIREGQEVRHLGVVVSACEEEVQQLTFGHQPGALLGKASKWKLIHPRIPERVHVARTFLLSTLVFQCRFTPPSPAQVVAIQAVLRGFLRQSDLPEETPFQGAGLQPSEEVWALPKGEGGWGMPAFGPFSAAMAARTVATLFSPGPHPWKVVTLHQFRSASPSLTNSAAWVVTAPHLFRVRSPRLRAMASAISKLGVHRIILPADQSFHSVMAEPVLANRQISRGHLLPRLLRPSDFSSQEAKAWSHLRDVRRSFQMHASDPILPRDLQFLLPLLPPPWRALVTMQGPDPIGDWVTAGHRQVLYRGAGGPTLFTIGRQGKMVKVGTQGGGGGDGGAAGGQGSQRVEAIGGGVGGGEPALVYHRMGASPSPPHAPMWESDVGGLTFVGPWSTLELDPTVWGIGPSQPLLNLRVRHARQRLAQHLVMEEVPSYIPGKGLFPPTWEQSPVTASWPGATDTLGPGGDSLAAAVAAAATGAMGGGPVAAATATTTSRDGQATAAAAGVHGQALVAEETRPPALSSPQTGLLGLEAKWTAPRRSQQRTPRPLARAFEASLHASLPSWLASSSAGMRGAGGAPTVRAGGEAQVAAAEASLGPLFSVAGIRGEDGSPAVRAGGEAEVAAAEASLGPLFSVAGISGIRGAEAQMAAAEGRERRTSAASARVGVVTRTAATQHGQGVVSPSSFREDDTRDFLQPARQGTLQGDSGGVWGRLHHSGGTQAAIGVGWRLLHASLPVRARVAYQLGMPLSEGVCEAPGCRCQETLSHAFMDCPKVRGAVDWLLGLFERLTGRRPPRDPRVILVDDHRVWEPGGGKEDRDLWQRLRLIFLYNAWKARSSRSRCQASGGGDLVAAIIGGATADVVASIRRDWARTRLDATREEAGGQPCNFLGRDPSMSLEVFQALWARRGVFCQVQGSGHAARLVLSDPSAWLSV